MSKAILISIHPNYVAKILNGEKTLEIRKSKPMCELPIDVYVYCSKDKPRAILTDKGCVVANTLNVGGSSQYKSGYSLSGRVVAKFRLNTVSRVAWYNRGYECGYIYEGIDPLNYKSSCLSMKELHQYLCGKSGYAWHIDDLEIFQEPKELSEFKTVLQPHKPSYYLERPPQSYCYCEVSEMDKLQEWLDKNNIKYDRFIEGGKINRNQILIQTDKIELSFICHYGSYGYKQGLIEMYDFQNEPLGFLTAEDCINKIKEAML